MSAGRDSDISRPSDRDSVLQAKIECVKRGDEAAINDLILRAQQRLRGLVATIFHAHGFKQHLPELDTTDVFHDLVVELKSSFGETPPKDVDHLFRLTGRITRNSLIDLLRKQPRGGFAPLSSDLADPKQTESSAEFSQTQLGEAVLRSVDGLSEGERRLFDLHWTDGLPLEAIAKMLGVSHSTVKRGWNKVKIHLTGKLEHYKLRASAGPAGDPG